MVFVTGMIVVIHFHAALMKDPSNIHEFARTAHRPPTAPELSTFLYWDALGGALNHLWIGPLLGLTVGGIGAILGKLAHDGAAKKSAHLQVAASTNVSGKRLPDLSVDLAEQDHILSFVVFGHEERLSIQGPGKIKNSAEVKWVT
jgi:hypothetical protein